MAKNDNFLGMVPRKGKTVRIDTSSFRAEPPIWFGMVFLGFGLTGLAPLIRIPDFIEKHDMTYLFPVVCSLLWGGLFTAAGVLLLYLRFDIPRSVPIEGLTQRLGLSEDEIRQVADQRGVLPRYHIKGRDFYRLDDFDTTSLLRASSEPVPTETLLRAATGASGSPDLLVRSSSAPPAGGPAAVEPVMALDEKTSSPVNQVNRR